MATKVTNGVPRASEWDSPAYEVLRQHGLLDSQWRKSDVTEMVFREGNSTPLARLGHQIASCVFPPLCCFLRTKEVPSGAIVPMQDGRGGFDWLGNRGPYQGVHVYYDLFFRIESSPVPLSATDPRGSAIRNGDSWVVVVSQGFVGLAFNMGQPVLLPPGLHQWKSATLIFDRNIDLSQPVIPIGPYTLLTVDRGYEAVTQNNGRQEVLPGGAVHLLTHKNWKFEKFISRKIQTDDLQRAEVMTGDNVLMHVTATVCWQITDVQTCVERAVDTMGGPTAQAAPSNGRQQAPASLAQYDAVSKLRNDVLKQAEASLSALVGKVHFSSTFSAATALQLGPAETGGGAAGRAAAAGAPAPPPDKAFHPPAPSHSPEFSQLFDAAKLDTATAHANAMSLRYGVEVLSINIISAKPADPTLVQSLAQGAVAAAEAQQLETTARGRAKAAAIDARGRADALKITAQADAEAEVTRAEGSKQAATLLNEEPVAVELARINATGAALAAAKSNLIMSGAGAGAAASVGSLLSNPNITEHAMGRAARELPDAP